MRLPRRRFLHLAAIAIGTLAAPGLASAQAYPTRPIQVIVPFAGGSASDVVMRILLDRMAKSIGQPFVVDNRPGAGGNIGTSAATKATPDGYTLVMGSTGPLAANRTLYRDLGYDPEKDLEPISLFAHFPILIVVSSKLPVKSVGEFVTYAKTRPKQLNYGSVGIGSSQHLAGVYFEQVAGLELTHVPYRNIAQYVPDLIAGAVPVGFQWLPNVSAPLQSGDARALAVAASKRMTALPDVPTVAEAGIKNYEASGWLALLAPHGTPKPIIARLNEELVAAVNDPSVTAKIIEQGAEGVSTTPEELAKFIASESAKWRAIIVKAGIPPFNNSLVHARVDQAYGGHPIGCASSTSLASDRMRGSSNRGATICKPTGSPSLVLPAGTLPAGRLTSVMRNAAAIQSM
jgi:tripartite-type tricarboxylate transporter receptor subunit TctC